MARITTDSITTIKKGASTASATINVSSDGQYTFTGTDGLVYRTSDVWAAKLFAVIDALV